MQASKYFLLCTVVVAIGVMFAATEVKAQPRQCMTELFTVDFIGRFPDADQGTARWQYKVQAADARLLESIIEGVMVVPLPVTPNDIKSPPPTIVQNFCDEADPNSRINRGNCAGFPVHLRPVKNGDGVLLEIITADNIIPGVVTLNIASVDKVKESFRFDVCVAIVNDQPTGIMGPGAPGGPDPLQPVFVTQEVLAAGGNCIAQLRFDARGRLIDVQSLGPADPESSTQCFRVSITRLLITPEVGGRIGSPQVLRNSTGPLGITFSPISPIDTKGHDTASCWGPDIPSPIECICTTEDCQ
jgi:hypothetical protein